MLEDIIAYFIACIGLSVFVLMVGFSLIGLEFVLRFWKSNTFETKKWRYTRVRKDNA